MSRPPTRVVIIAASPRTGSNLLCRSLSATGRVGDPAEHVDAFVQAMQRGGLPWSALTARGVASRVRRRLRGESDWRRTLPNRVRRRHLVEYLRQCAAEHTGADGTYAVKLMWGHFGGTMLAARVDADVWGAPVTWIHLRRHDALAQAVSWCRAEQTRQWVRKSEVEPPVDFDPDRIRRLLTQAKQEDAAWCHFFESRRLAPIEVVYEDLVSAYEPTMQRVLAGLGHAGVPVPPPQIERQSGAASAEWIRRLREMGVQ